MNRKQFIALLVAVVIVGAAGWIVYRRGNQSWQYAGSALGKKLLPDFEVNDVAAISIRSGTNRLTLAKSKNLWRVRERGDYPADFSQISDTLLKFAGLKIVQNEEVEPSQLGRFDLSPSDAARSGTEVQFQGEGGKTLASVRLGKKHLKQATGNSQFDQSWPDGRYVAVGQDTGTVDVISDPLDTVQPDPKSWLDKTFFRIQNPKSIALDFPAATNSWKLERATETNDWQLAGARPGEKLDASKIGEVTDAFSSPSFDDVSAGASVPANATALTVETFDGFTYHARIGAEQDGDYPFVLSVTAHLPAARTPVPGEKPAEKAKLDAAFRQQQSALAARLAQDQKFEHWTYRLPSYSVESFLKPRAELLAEVKPAGTNAPAAPAK